MAIVSDVEIRLRADIARLQADMTQARRTVENATSGMSSAVEKFKSALGGLAVGAIFAKLQADIIGAQREFDKLNVSLITATGSSANAAQAFAALQRFAATTPFDLKQVTEGFLKLRNLGLTPSERALTSYGNTAGAMGKSLNQMIEAVADAATGEFERLKEFGIKAKQQGDFVTLNFQGVTTKIGNNAAAIEKYLMKIGEVNFGGGMALQAKTLDGAISNLGDAWDATLRTFAQSGFGDSAMAKTLALTNALADLQAIFLATGLAVRDEGKAVSENGFLHKALTTVFETIAVMGEQVAFVFRAIGGEIGGLAAQAAALFTGRFKDIGVIHKQMVADAAEDRRMTDARVEKILWAAAVEQKVRDNEAEAKERDKTDDLARYKVVGDGKKAQTDAEKKAAEEALAFYKKTKEAAEDNIALLGTELNARDGLTDGQKKAISVLGDLVKFSGNLSAAQKRTIAALTEEGLRLERLTEARKADKKAQEEAEAASAKDTEAAWDKVRALQEQIKTYGMTETAVLQLQATEYQRQLGAAELSDMEQSRLSSLLAATQEQITLQTKLTKMKAATGFWTGMESAAHDMFMSIENGNSNLWQRMKDSAKNMFFEWLYQMTLKKWIINIGASISGEGGVSGIAGAADALSGKSSGGGAIGAFSSLSSLYSVGKAIYTGFSAGIGSSLGTVIQGLGQTFGSAAMTSFGAGMGMTTAEAAAAVTAANAAAAGSAAAGSTAAAGGALSAGASASAAIPIVGWIMAGMMSASMFRQQGFDPNNGTTSLAGKIVGAVPLLLNKQLQQLGMGSALANILTGASLNTKLFGRANPVVENQGLRGTASATGITAENYANILEKGGWFRSDKRYTNTAALDQGTADSFSMTMRAMVESVKGFGTSMGLAVDNIDGYTKAFDIALGSDATKNQEAVTALFSTIGDELSTRLIPSLAQFATTGETASATLQRLATDYATVDAALLAVGGSFKSVGVLGITAREGLIAAAGGLDALSKGLAFFQADFLSEAEQLAPIQKQVADALGALGMAGVKTVDQFKTATLKAIQGEDTALIAKLLALAPAFKVVADAAAAAQKAAEDLAAAQAAAAKAAQDAAKAAADATATANAQMLKDAASAALAGLQRSVDAQKAANQKAFDELMAGIGASIDAASAKVNTLQGLTSALGSGISSGAGPGAVDSARAALAAAAQVARVSGVLPTADAMRDVLATLRADNSGQFSTLIEYQRATAAANVDIGDIAGITDTQLSVAQSALLVLRNQQAAAQAAYTIEAARLDSMVTAAQASLDKLSGIYTGVLALPEALANFAAAIQSAMANPIAAQGATTQTAYGQYLNRPATDAEVAYWKDQAAKGASVVDMVKGSDEAKIQALYAKYLGRAGEAAGVNSWEASLAAGQTWAQIEQGFATSAEAKARGGAGDVVAAAVDALTAQMGAMQASMQRTANSTAQLADQFNNVTAGGNAMATETP